MALSSWSSMSSSKVLPLSGHANQLQYRHYINWELNLNNFFGIQSEEGVGKWRMRIKNPNGLVVLEQEVQVRIQVVSLGQMGVVFYTWSFRKEDIKTTMAAGTATGSEDNPSWKYTVGGTETAEQGTLNPGGGSDFGVGMAYINAFWESPLYKLDVEPGAVLEVDFDSWGLGASTRPEWQFRFNYGVLNLIGTSFGPFGELIAAHGMNKRNSIQMGDSWPSHQSINDRFWIEDATDPTVLTFPNGKRIVVVLQKDGYWEYETFDAGMSFSKVGYPTEIPGDFAPESIFGPEVSMPKVVKVGFSRLAFALRGNEMRSRRVDNEGLGPLVVIGNATSGESYDLSVDEKGVVYVVNSSGIALHKSVDIGSHWEPVEVLEEANA